MLLLSVTCCTNPSNHDNTDGHKTKSPVPVSAPAERAMQVHVLYRSLDNGQHWSEFSNELPSEATVIGIVEKESKLFIATNFHGVFISENGSNHWKSIMGNLPNGIDINAIITFESALVIGTLKHGVYVSLDEGVTWHPAATNLQRTSIRSLIALKGKLLAGTDNGIYTSIDEGNNWEHIYGGKQVTGFTILNGKTYAGLSNGAIMSKDNGDHWQYIYQPDALHDISNDGVYVYAMTMGEGLLRTKTDGVQWENANNGFGNLYTFEVKNVGNDLFAAQWYGIYHSMNRGNSWRKLSTGSNGLPDSTAFTVMEITKSGILAAIGLRK